MKKLLSLLIIMLLSASYTFASNTLYDTELSKIRTVKNAKVSAINKQINNITELITELELNTTIEESKKKDKMEIYTKKLDELANKKAEISEQYKKDKAILKKKYK